MDRTEVTVRNVLTAIEAPLYDAGLLSDRGMLPGLDGIPEEAVPPSYGRNEKRSGKRNYLGREGAVGSVKLAISTVNFQSGQNQCKTDL
jgi:hypothetical protein